MTRPQHLVSSTSHTHRAGYAWIDVDLRRSSFRNCESRLHLWMCQICVIQGRSNTPVSLETAPHLYKHRSSSRGGGGKSQLAWMALLARVLAPASRRLRHRITPSSEGGRSASSSFSDRPALWKARSSSFVKAEELP